jgi:hypothetical protein
MQGQFLDQVLERQDLPCLLHRRFTRQEPGHGGDVGDGENQGPREMLHHPASGPAMLEPIPAAIPDDADGQNTIGIPIFERAAQSQAPGNRFIVFELRQVGLARGHARHEGPQCDKKEHPQPSLFG